MMTKTNQKPSEMSNDELKFELDAACVELICTKIKLAIIEIVENEKPHLTATALMMLSASLFAYIYRNQKKLEKQKELIDHMSEAFTKMTQEYINQLNKEDND
jgi:hypothetical protein